ncbi:hypothetical protein PL583_20180, partial [Phocaeicola vulgatus]|nr:hypothetical protein [Phocaeicola vulgatus]
LTDFFILSAEKQPIKLSWRNIEWLQDNRLFLKEQELFLKCLVLFYRCRESVSYHFVEVSSFMRISYEEKA